MEKLTLPKLRRNNMFRKTQQISAEKAQELVEDLSNNVKHYVSLKDFLKENMPILLKYNGSLKDLQTYFIKHDIDVGNYSTFVTHFKKIKDEYLAAKEKKDAEGERQSAPKKEIPQNED
jgi:hypothetical protein